MDIHNMLDPMDQAYFRGSREGRYNKTLEEVVAATDVSEFKARTLPLKLTLRRQPYLGGDTPLFADYIVFGALQWVRVTSKFDLFSGNEDVGAWFERCLDLHNGLGRSVPAAA